MIRSPTVHNPFTAGQREEQEDMAASMGDPCIHLYVLKAWYQFPLVESVSTHPLSQFCLSSRAQLKLHLLSAHFVPQAVPS